MTLEIDIIVLFLVAGKAVGSADCRESDRAECDERMAEQWHKFSHLMRIA